ncbi:tensin-3 isoform X1 [Poecilia formosa]|uniref:tensin-3 isoform X1 n=1 Tax=Poecilia formosa TaxID=48698 RepID=UPI0004443847|nr:PREDICTED: tensin-3 isoform X1 [Poecilia formosa]
MEEGYELDLTYITERIIAVSFPRGCSEEIYSLNLKDVTRMLKSKHADNYLIINLSERRHDLTRMNPKTLDTGWPDLHAPPLDKICTICKAMESWLNADPLHVVVIHCRGGKGRIGVVISSFVHFTDVSASADQALDRFAMRKYYDDKVSALMTPSQKRYVWILNSLLSGSMKINASPLFLHCVVLHGIPNFEAASRVCCPYIKVYQGMQAVYSSGVYHIGSNHRDRVCINLEPAQLLKGDIMIKCYHKSDVTSEREVIFRLQFHTGAVQGYNLIFEKEDMENANKDPRFPDYGKVELIFSEGPERIPGADRWQNGPDVIVDYNTADPLTRWDSYKNICDGEAPRSQGLNQDKAASKRSAVCGEATLGRGTRTTSTTSSPDHSDHALSVSSDSGLSSTSLWAERQTPVVTTTTSTTSSSSSTTTTTVRANQGPSPQEKVQLKQLLSGFGLEDPSLDEMDDPGPKLGLKQTLPVQLHFNGDTRPRERETDILDDEVNTGHDLHSLDSLGTLSSSCHKSSQNSLLSDGFGCPGSEDHHNQHHLHHTAPQQTDDFERRTFLSSRSNSVTSSNPSSAPTPKQHVYRQESYSTQSWVRQQQMVAAQQFNYMPEDGNETERYSGIKSGSGSPKESLANEPQNHIRDTKMESVKNTVPHKEQPTTNNNNNNNKHDDEIKSLTMDIDNSIDQLNQLIMDLDPMFVPRLGFSKSTKRDDGTQFNGSVRKNSNSTDVRFNDCNTATLKNPPQTVAQSNDVRSGITRSLSCQGKDVMDHHSGFCNSGWGDPEEYKGQQTYPPCISQFQHPTLYRSDSTSYRTQGLDNTGGIETGLDMTPPTPAFPISPPTPYVKTMSEFSELRQIPSPNMQSFGGFGTNQEPHGHSVINHVSFETLPDSSISCHRMLNSTYSTSITGNHQQTDSSSVSQSWPEHHVLTHHSSLSNYPSVRQPPPPSVSLEYGHHSPLHPPLHHPHAHPVPNAHSSPRSSQRSRLASYTISRSPQRFDEQDSSLHGYGKNCLDMGIDRDLLASMDGQHQLQFPQTQPPLLPEKKRVSDGEHSLGTVSPALSGFSSPHSGSSLSIPFPNVLPDLSAQTPLASSPLPDVLVSKQVTVKFVQDTSKFWYKPDISRDQAISVLKEKEPGCFIVRDSHSFKGAYGLAMKVSTPPLSVIQQSRKGGDLSNELVRHFLIECTQKGVRLKGCPNEPYFGSLTALVYQHSITPLALPCKLIIPDKDPLEDVVESVSHSVTNSATELLKQGAACNVWYLSSVEMESLTGVQAVQKATTMTLDANPPPVPTVVHFKVSSQGITLTDNQRKLFFRRHYNVNTVIFCALDPQDRKWKKDGCPSAKIFGFVARKTGTSLDNVCHLFAEHDPEQPASAIVNFVSKVMIGSQRSK